MMSKTKAYEICKHLKEIAKDEYGSDSSYVEALGIVIDREEQPDEWMYLGFMDLERRDGHTMFPPGVMRWLIIPMTIVQVAGKECYGGVDNDN